MFNFKVIWPIYGYQLEKNKHTSKQNQTNNNNKRLGTYQACISQNLPKLNISGS